MVVYDQSTRDASVLATDSFLSILLSKLDGCFDSVAILTGELRGALWRQDVLSSLSVSPAMGSAGGQGHGGSQHSGCTSVLSKPRTQHPLGLLGARVSVALELSGLHHPLPWAPTL